MNQTPKGTERFVRTSEIPGGCTKNNLIAYIEELEKKGWNLKDQKKSKLNCGATFSQGCFGDHDPSTANIVAIMVYEGEKAKK